MTKCKRARNLFIELNGENVQDVVPSVEMELEGVFLEGIVSADMAADTTPGNRSPGAVDEGG